VVQGRSKEERVLEMTGCHFDGRPDPALRKWSMIPCDRTEGVAEIKGEGGAGGGRSAKRNPIKDNKKVS